MRLPVSILLFLTMHGSAHAHWGHLGEVGGHAHWIALGAGVTAAALAAWLGKQKIKADAEDGAEAGEEGDAEAVDEPSSKPVEA